MASEPAAERHHLLKMSRYRTFRPVDALVMRLVVWALGETGFGGYFA